MTICVPKKRTTAYVRHAGSGFTLVELMVVIAIIALLASMIIPVISRALNKAHVAVCFSNMRQVGAGFTLYAADHEGYYPVCKDGDFRGGPYGIVKILESYFPFGTMIDAKGNKTEWVDSKYTCPMFRKMNKDYNPKDLAYGSYAYRHAFRGKWSGAGGPPPEPYANGSTLAGRRMAELIGDGSAPTYSLSHWTPSIYGIVWDAGWTEYPMRTEPHNYYGIAAHQPFHVLFADLHVAKSEWVHREGQIPAGVTQNIPPEKRDDQYHIKP